MQFMKMYGVWIAVAMAVVAVGGWFKSEMNAAGDRREAGIMADSAEAGWSRLVDSTEAWDVRKTTWDSTKTSLTAELDSGRVALGVIRESASQTVRTARNRIQALSDSVTTLTQEDLEAITAGINSLEVAEAACTAALGTCEQLVEAADTRVWDLQEQARQSMDLNRNQAVTIDRLRDIRKPSIGTVGYLGWVTAVVVIVVSVLQ